MRKVLLIEDDETLNKNITMVLEAESYVIVNADSIKYVRMFVNSVDLIVLDVIFPDVDDYITKPFRLRELVSRIRVNLRRIPEISEIEFTALKQKLLDYLVLNRAQYLTREQILDYLWKCKGTFVNDNILDVQSYSCV